VMGLHPGRFATITSITLVIKLLMKLDMKLDILQLN